MAGVAVAADRISKVRRAPAELRAPLTYVPLPFNAMTLPWLRLAMASPLYASAPAPAIPGVASRHQTIPGPAGGPDVGVHLHERPDRPKGSPVVLWIHGGGYVVGTAAMSTPQCRAYANELNVLVAAVDYRLAPEHPFPAGLDDCAAALAWLRANAGELGIDPERIAVGGDSAGGGLAACLVQRDHDERRSAGDAAGPGIAFQLLVYPMLDDRTCLSDPPIGVGELGWTPASNRFGWASYLGAEPGAASAPPYAAAARRDSLAGLPPAWIGVGTTDLFHAEDVAYAERLRTDGVPVTLDVLEGLYHAADAMAPAASLSKRFREAQLDALRTGLGLDA
jgi:acetyl esterase/lipase